MTETTTPRQSLVDYQRQQASGFVHSLPTKALPLRASFHKHGSAGWTVFASQRSANLVHSVLQFLVTLGGRQFTVLLGQIAFIEQREPSLSQPYKPFNQRVGSKRLSDVVDLSSFITAAGVFKESGFSEVDGARRDIHQLAVRSTDHGVELCFDHDARPLPECPANYLFSAYSRQCLWHDDETFAAFCARQGLIEGVNRFPVGNHVSAKR